MSSLLSTSSFSTLILLLDVFLGEGVVVAEGIVVTSRFLELLTTLLILVFRSMLD